MKTINILNEKGNVIPSVRTAIREQVINYLTTNTKSAAQMVYISK